jgi:hypothetical protein
VRVLCCYTPRDPAEDGRFHLHSSARAGLASVREHVPGAEMVDVSGDDFAYWREIRARWTGEEDLATVEHDIEVTPGAVKSLAACDQPWCAFSYEIFGCKELATGLGCTRFSAALQGAVDLGEVAASFAHCRACHGEGCWWHLDNYLAAFLSGRGFAPHVHGRVPHLHDYGPPGTLALAEGITTVYSWEAGSDPVQYHVCAPQELSPEGWEARR